LLHPMQALREAFSSEHLLGRIGGLHRNEF
jgi:hypothetical protein